MTLTNSSVVASAVPAARLFRDDTGLRLQWRILIASAVIAIGWIWSSFITNHMTYTITAILAWSLIASSLNITVGFAGQLNLAQGGFLALGAYLGVLGTGHWGWPGERTLLVAGVAAYLLSTLLGFVIFRARGLHFALLTAGISIVTYNVLISWQSVTGGASGISTAGPIAEGGSVRPLVLFGLEFRTAQHYLLVMLVALVVLTLAISIISRRKMGLSWQAIRDDEVLAASVGIKVNKGKRSAFVASSVLAALSGVLFGHWLGFITPGSFSFVDASFEPLAMVIIGGGGTLLGPIFGALLVVGIPEVFKDFESVSSLIYGILLLLVILLAPKGLMGVVTAAGRSLGKRGMSLVKGKKS